MTARFAWAITWTRLFAEAPALPGRNRCRVRSHPAGQVADEEARLRRLFAAVPPLCLLRL